jgi:hypothetical protein
MRDRAGHLAGVAAHTSLRVYHDHWTVSFCHTFHLLGSGIIHLATRRKQKRLDEKSRPGVSLPQLITALRRVADGVSFKRLRSIGVMFSGIEIENTASIAQSNAAGSI